MIDRGYPQFVQRLEKSGITVVSLQPGTVEEMLVYWQILGHPDRPPGPRPSAMADRLQGGRWPSSRRSRPRVNPKKRVYFEAIHAQDEDLCAGRDGRVRARSRRRRQHRPGRPAGAGHQHRRLRQGAHPGPRRRNRRLPRPVRHHEPADRRTHQGRERLPGHPGGEDRPSLHHRRAARLAADPAAAGRDIRNREDSLPR
ncbi:MAG: hypothetical protein MZV70_29795 [Desulfobacterales bacterium]|nr:hypothetical protein [Desulfobacterales bacterium]